LGSGEQLAFDALAVADAELGTVGMYLDFLASTNKYWPRTRADEEFAICQVIHHYLTC